MQTAAGTTTTFYLGSDDGASLEIDFMVFVQNSGGYRGGTASLPAAQCLFGPAGSCRPPHTHSGGQAVPPASQPASQAPQANRL